MELRAHLASFQVTPSRVKLQTLLGGRPRVWNDTDKLKILVQNQPDEI